MQPLRQLFITALVLLQFAAPLLHAHAVGQGVMQGLHLHEFERLVLKTHHPVFQADQGIAADNQASIISVGSAIKQQPNLDLQPLLFLLPTGFVLALRLRRVGYRIKRPPPPTVFIPPALFKAHASRAPPAFA